MRTISSKLVSPLKPRPIERLVSKFRGQPATCNFNYTGPMAETVLLGNIAYRIQGGFEWDASELKPTGNDAAEQYIREPFRKGWEI